MIITYNGVESFKISQGDLSLALNPVSKDSKYKSSRFGADITIITTNHPDTNGHELTSRGEKETFVINGPGEYEVKDVTVKGFLTDSGLPHSSLNTVYQITFEGMDICFLGTLGNPAMKPEVIEALEDIDILFVPIGGGGVLDPASAYKLSVSLEPKIIIPMYYPAVGESGPGGKDALKLFLKEGGDEKVVSQDKLVVKKKDLEGKQSRGPALPEGK